MGMAWKAAEESHWRKESRVFHQFLLRPWRQREEVTSEVGRTLGDCISERLKQRSEADWVWRRQRRDEGLQLAFLLPGLSGPMGSQRITIFIFRA